MKKNKFDIYDERIIYLLEVASYFNSGNRSEITFLGNQKKCIYGGSGCAIGIKIKNKSLCERLDTGAGGTGTAVNKPHIYNKLPVYLKKYGLDFLKIIQQLHDSSSNWDNYGLFSESRFWEIFDEYCIDEYNRQLIWNNYGRYGRK